jgi:UDP-GlcNAc:undecaprenyl-phosphate/decaprenyl-phosphate GlcNAc-1-phosphate transferase
MLSLSLLHVLSSFLVSAAITSLSIPKIIKVVVIKKLSDKPGSRKVHTRCIPTLGGIAIFSGFFISLMLFNNGNIKQISIIAAATMIMFLIGQKDDLINMNARKKFFFEFMVATLITFATDLRITSFQGFLGFQIIPFWLSIIITVLLIVFIMNAFNLIDGIDGLAASIGIVSAAVYGVLFWLNGDLGYSIMSACIAGALCAFIPFNMYKGRFKIFMGDTGSLTIGLLLAILTLRFNALNAEASTSIKFISSPAISLGILFLPLFDTLRVTIIRLHKKSNPFIGDNNHLHHRLLRYGLNHFQATLVMIIFNIAIIIFTLCFDNLGVLVISAILFTLAVILSFFSAKLEIHINSRREASESLKNLIEYNPRLNWMIESNIVPVNMKKVNKESETMV